MDEQEEIQNLSQELIKKLQNNTQNFVSTLKSVLLGDEKDLNKYDDYLNQLQKTLKKCTCQHSWSSDEIIVKCADCQKSNDSCICVKCFFKGNHQGHNISLIHSKSGTCDCGDALFWSPEGFCSDHPGPEPNPEKSQLNRETRVKLISICRVCLYYMASFAKNSKETLNEVTDFLTKIVSLGDATRRCVCLAFEGFFNYYNFFINCYALENNEIVKLRKFFGSLTNDEVFRNFFSFSFVNDFPKFIIFVHERALEKTSSSSKYAVHQLYDITFHATNDPSVAELTKKGTINLSEILFDSIDLLFTFNFAQMSRDYMANSEFLVSITRIFSLLKTMKIVYENKSDEMIEFVSKFCSFFVEKEFSFPLTRVFGNKYDDPKMTQSALFTIYYHAFHLVSKLSSKEIYTKEPLKMIATFFNDEKFQSIDKDYQKKSENNSIYYHSVLDRNVQFTQSFLAHILAFVCLNLKDKMSLYDYISEVTDDVEKFIRNWALLPLRFIAASSLEDFDFFVRNSDQAINSLISFNFLKNVKIKFVPTFNLIQTLLKTTKDVDDFLLMIISTHGFFKIDKEEDQFDDNQKRLILLTIFHFISCLIFDKMCIEKDFFTMRRLKIIMNLMKGNMSIENINKSWYGRGLLDEKFLEDLKSYASKVTTKNGTQFHLTDGSEWHPLLPYIKLSSIIPFIQEFINKNPDSLISFPSLPEDSTRLLFSPTLWALEYFILSHESCKDYQIIHQLILNVLIITSNHIDKSDTDSESNEIIRANDFTDLILHLKKLTFSQFLRSKIVFQNGSNEKSMIDLISQLGNVGITALVRMNVSDVNSSSSEKSQQAKEALKEKNRERAKALKMKIMGSFNQQQKSFQSQTSQLEEETTKSSGKFDCSVCHLDNEEDCFVYPALVFDSPLSSFMKFYFSKNKPTENEPFDVFTSVQICLHPIHSKCIQKGNYPCPTDRCPRNSALPIISGIYDDRSIENTPVQSSAQKFLNQAYHNDIKLAVYSLASQIELVEVRHRSNPGCLDNQTIGTMLRNIYLCIFHLLLPQVERALINEEFIRRRDLMYKLMKEGNSGNSEWMKLKEKLGIPESYEKEDVEKIVDEKMNIILPREVNDQTDKFGYDGLEFFVNEKKVLVQRKMIRLTALMKYIMFSMQLNENKHSINMNDFVNGKIHPSSIHQQLNEDDFFFVDSDVVDELSDDYNMFQFLRCAALFDHFARDNKITQDQNGFVDWDAILSFTSLLNHYGIDRKSDDFVLPMFSFIDLPKFFIDFVHKPYSAPVLTTAQGEIYIDLLSGKLTRYKSDKNSPSEYLKIRDFVAVKYRSSFAILLSVNGKDASRIIVYVPKFHAAPIIRSCYVDKFGGRDVGLKRGSNLQLDESARDEIVDNLLSGQWTNGLKKIYS